MNATHLLAEQLKKIDFQLAGLPPRVQARLRKDVEDLVAAQLLELAKEQEALEQKMLDRTRKEVGLVITARHLSRVINQCQFTPTPEPPAPVQLGLDGGSL
jgi:hypothetical protein